MTKSDDGDDDLQTFTKRGKFIGFDEFERDGVGNIVGEI